MVAVRLSGNATHAHCSIYLKLLHARRGNSSAGTLLMKRRQLYMQINKVYIVVELAITKWEVWWEK